MYSTCIFCNADLGRNEALEHFPVGRRLAFDGRKGRLWVVCRRCERWNLTPLEERWEAVEEAERLFRGTRQRVSTEHIGLTRTADGTDLVRIGDPLRPEFAAWRYGDQFGRRRRRRLVLAGGGIGALGLGIAGGAMAGLAVGMFGGVAAGAMETIVNGRAERVVARLRTESAGDVAVRRRNLAETRLVAGADGPLAVDLAFHGGTARLDGREALRVAGALMPHVNRYGGRSPAVRSAVGFLDAVGAEGFLEQLGVYAPDATAVRLQSIGKPKPKTSWSGRYDSGLFRLSEPDRIALEMALHEEAELRAVRGELAELEAAWRDAEGIAAIADDLLLPPSIGRALGRLRGGGAE